jgi:hypothetical protein
MSDGAHLLIPLASSEAQGCIEARRILVLPALEKLLARLRLDRVDEGDEHTLSMPHEREVAHASGLHAPDGCIPWAAWQVEQGIRDTQGAAWAWITPCHWHVGRDHIAMSNPQQLQLSAQESQALLAAMRPYFEEDGIALEYDAPTSWLARGEVFRDFPSASLDRVIGRTIDPWLPRSDSAKSIRRLQQEMQMLLYTNETNEDRLRGGQQPVNSFWVSGTGALPSSPAPQVPQGLQVVDDLHDAAMLGDWGSWASAWQQVDARECTGLLQSLDAGHAVSLTLCGERNARTWGGAGGGFLRNVLASMRGKRVAAALESL